MFQNNYFAHQKYSSTLSLTSAIDGDGWLTARPGRCTPGTHCIGGWVGPIVGMDGCGKSHRSWIQSLDSTAHSENTILTKLSWPGQSYVEAKHCGTYRERMGANFERR
jgi:hypothetical protein